MNLKKLEIMIEKLIGANERLKKKNNKLAQSIINLKKNQDMLIEQHNSMLQVVGALAARAGLIDAKQ